MLAGAALAGGCGGGSGIPDYYAGLEQYEAAAAARTVISEQTALKSSPVYRRALTFRSMEPSSRAGFDAWLIHYETPDGVASTTCVWIWSGPKAAFQRNYVFDVDDCPDDDAV